MDRKAHIWNQRNKGEGEPYKKYVTDPIILGLINPNNKIILDQGCGNGHLSKKISSKNPKKIILLDFYEGNLNFAKENLKSIKADFEFKQADFNKKLKLKSSSVDIAVSSFVLSEIEDLKLIMEETYRILKNKGEYVIAVTHPFYDLKHYFYEKITGKASKKIVPVMNYFDKRKSEFVLGVETHEEIRAPHYHRTIEDYVTSLASAGFLLNMLIEPKLNDDLLKAAPRFKEDADYPISLLLKAVK